MNILRKIFHLSPIGIQIYTRKFILKERRFDYQKKFVQFKGIVDLDQDKIVRMFYNIASNARDAMPQGCILTVTTIGQNGYVRIDFTDTGTGMPEEVKKRIFEPFMTYGKKHGTGLGMSIVKKVIEDHKGTIEINSVMGKGTTITMYLPIKNS